MIWLIAAAVLLILVFVVNWRRPLPRTAMIVIGGAFVAVGFLRIAYVEWDYLAVTTKPLDVPLPLARAATLNPPPFIVERPGEYDVWLQTDRPSALLDLACNDPDNDGPKSCPERRRALQLDWTVGDEVRAFGITHTLSDAYTPDSTPSTKPLPPPRGAPSNASDNTPKYRFLGSFVAKNPGRFWLSVDVVAPDPPLAARHPRLIVGLSDAETAPAGYFATLFCVLCVFGGGFILLKTLVPRKSPA
jgi:hypothetical protein